MTSNDRFDDLIPRGGTLLGVWAHPDDEAYLSAGLMTRVLARGGRVVVAFATRGEAGTDDPVTWPPAKLAARREVEAAAALHVMGAEPPRFLGHADGQCAAVDPAIGAAQVEALIDEVRPDLVVGFGRDGITGHADHRAVSAWTVDGWRRVRRRRLGVPQLVVAAMTGDFVDRNARLHDEIGLFDDDGPRVTAPADVALRLDLTATELDRKEAALRAHASQTRTLADHLGRHRYRHWWASESFRRPDATEMGTGSEWVAA